jgi:predicted RecB family nuclease
MQLLGKRLLLSASDLVSFLACSHLTALELERAHGHIPAPPPRAADTAVLVARKGDEYERRYLEKLRAEHGEALVEIETGAGQERLVDAAAQTREAMEAGAPVIYQAAFLDGDWMGYVDFLERVESPSDLGGWSYEPADTKLARSVKPHFVIQLCLYAELIAAVQGIAPRRMHVILGDEERQTLACGDFQAYFRRMKDMYVATLDGGLTDTYPDPVEHCDLCRWSEQCEERRTADDHLSLVAKLGGVQAANLQSSGISTVAELASAAPEQRPSSMAAGTFERLRSQADLQVQERRTGELVLQRLEPELPGEGPLRGFARMPAPSPGDVFFDIEGDPFYDEGLEYLWGATYMEDGKPAFKAFWGTDHKAEKGAFEAFVDFVFERRERYPEMHVYHYAPYERTALRQMMGLHATREEEVDRLLRQHVLVDLYRVVDQALRISRPSYSLKEVEAFYDQARSAEVKQAGDSVLMFEQWLQEGDATLLEKIEAYNKEDCDSTLCLRDWLIEQRDLAEREFGVRIPRRAPGQPTEAEKTEDDAIAETAELQARLLVGVPADPDERSAEQRGLWLLAQLLDYHRREAKPAYWEYIARIDAEELTESDSESIEGLEPVGTAEPVGGRSRSLLQTMSFPRQEHKIKPGKFVDPGSCEIDEGTGEIDYWSADSVEVVEIDDERGTLVIKVGPSKVGAPLPQALIPGRPLPTEVHRAALRELAGEVSATGLAPDGRHTAARDILTRRPPRTSAVEPGGKLQSGQADLESTEGIARGLDGSYLFVQGPPGSGKTYTGAKLIIDLIAAGKRVGVSANSHKAICRLLAEIEKHAAPGSFKGLKRGSGKADAFESTRERPLIENSTKSADFPPAEDVRLIAGTSWLWCREEMRKSLDYLVIDEAGQISLADALAMSTASDNVILLGDPMQLGQVVQGVHPPGCGASVLEHLLGGEGTIPEDRGIFLEMTRRMHPDVCEFVSRAVYESRLAALPECEGQRIEAGGPLSGTGMRSIALEHHGNSRQSVEEAERIAHEAERLFGSRYTRFDGSTVPLEQAEIMVVTPYNAQVRLLRQELDKRGLTEVAAGTVDKFQGQEAAVVFFSMATSSGAEIPRNVEFLYSRNRLNVAVSRARCLAVLVASPALMTIECRTVEQMRLVNALCLLDEMGQSSHATAVPVGEE